jgi:hypothetical protein
LANVEMEGTIVVPFRRFNEAICHSIRLERSSKEGSFLGVPLHPKMKEDINLSPIVYTADLNMKMCGHRSKGRKETVVRTYCLLIAAKGKITAPLTGLIKFPGMTPLEVLEEIDKGVDLTKLEMSRLPPPWPRFKSVAKRR